MDRSVILVIVGGLISLISTIAGIVLQYWFNLHKMRHEIRRYPTEVLFNKQTEFYDKSVRDLQEVNGYITTINVWLGETSPDAKRKALEAAQKTSPIWKFHELIETFSMYLPKKILSAADELFEECSFLPHSPTIEKTEKCIGLLFSFQNTIRECVGVDKISDELLKAFGARERERFVRPE